MFIIHSFHVDYADCLPTDITCIKEINNLSDEMTALQI